MSVPVRLWRILTVAAVLLASLALVGVAYNYNQGRTEAERINDALAPLCGSQITTLQRAIEQRRSLPPSFFPDIPPPTFRELVGERNAEDRSTIATLRELCPDE